MRVAHFGLCSTDVNDRSSDEWIDLPLMLTVEEAAQVLRIGRSHAYNLTRVYFATGGTRGLPVLRLGNLLRVPRVALHEFVTTGQVMQLLPVPTATPSTPATGNRTPMRATRATDRSQLSLLGHD